MSEPILIREQRDAVLTLRLNRPEVRNALSAELIDQLGSRLFEAEEDPSIRVVLLTGTGDRAFCAGMDLRGFAENGAPMRASLESREIIERFVHGDYRKPVVGAANATAVAGGLELLLGCDVIVASRCAMFGLPEVKRGLFATGGGIFLSTRIPLAVALELALTGDNISAHRAYSLGLVNWLEEPSRVLDTAMAVADHIARNAPLAVEASKELVRLASTNVEQAKQRNTQWLPRVFESRDANEGATAFIEKRNPIWTGR
jgi:enoyl-CoA hydratase/carnithine racemase